MNSGIFRVYSRGEVLFFARRGLLSEILGELSDLSPEMAVQRLLNDRDAMRELRRYWLRYFPSGLLADFSDSEFAKTVETALERGECEAAMLSQAAQAELNFTSATSSAARRPQMKPKHAEAFLEAARLYNVYILVRRTNIMSLLRVGDPDCVPKRLDCKAKTADKDYSHPQYGAMNSAGLVVDPTIAGRAAFGSATKYDSALKEWEKFSHSIDPRVSTFEGQRSLTYIPNGGLYFVDLDPKSRRHGCVKFTSSSLMTAGRYIHGDFDLYGIVPAGQPSRNVAVTETRLGQRHSRSPEFFDVQHYINRKIGVAMVLHGAQESFAETHSDEGLDIFHPNGTISFVENASETSAIYRTLFEGRQLFTKKGATDFAEAGFVAAQRGDAEDVHGEAEDTGTDSPPAKSSPRKPPPPKPPPKAAPKPPATPSPKPTEKCNCCVTSVAIENVVAYKEGGRFGHNFDFVIKMNFAAGQGGVSDCSLAWNEKTNIPYIDELPLNTWKDLYAAYSQSPTFNPWKNRVVPCPSGGDLTVTIADIPGLGIRPGRTATRTLEFKLVVKSGSGGACASASATATAKQVLEIVDGVPSHPGTFTTP